MSKSYGMMVGCDTALTWVENLKGVDTKIQSCVLARMRYEFDKDIPVPPKFYKGKYGKKYDSYACGNCGFSIDVAIHKFCPNCGFAVARPTYR